MNRNIRHLCFDVDGTLYSFAKYPRLRKEILEHMCRIIRADNGSPIKEILKLYRRHYEEHESNSEIFSKFGIPKDYARFALASINTSKFLSQDPELLNLFNRLDKKEKISYSIYSNNTFAEIREILRKLELHERSFHFPPLSGDSFPKSSDCTKGYEEVCKRSGFEPQEILYVGDRQRAELWPAKNAGFKTALVWAESVKTYRTADVPKPDHVFKDIYSVADLVS